MLLLTLLLCLPLALWTVGLISDGWIPQGDDAILAIKTHDVFGTHPPLVGMRSTSAMLNPGVDAHHPGPMEFYLLAIPYAITGWQPWGLLAGCLIVACAFVAITIHSAYRAGRWYGVAIAAVILLATERFFTELLVHPVNLWPPVLAMIATLMLGWRLLLWQTRSLPLFVVCASFAAQAHIVFLPVVGALALMLSIIGVIRWQGARESIWPVPGYQPRNQPPIWRRPGWIATALVALCWWPALIDTLTFSPTNVGQLAKLGGAGPGQHTVGIVDAFKNYTRLATPIRQDVTINVATSVFWLQIVLVGAALLLCAWSARHLGQLVRRPSRAKDALAAASVIALTCALPLLWTGARTVGALRMLYLDILMPVALFATAVATWAALDLIKQRTRTPARTGLILAAAGCIVAVLIPTSLIQRLPSGGSTPDIARARTATTYVSSALEDTSDNRPIIVTGTGPITFASVGPAISAELIGNSREVYFDSFWPHKQDDDFRRTSHAPANAIHIDLREQTNGTWSGTAPTAADTTKTYATTIDRKPAQIQVIIRDH
ncbi:hypothetical protein [Luteipulveratus mongoliensis]|uniref:Glycosyltransferase RgtA/B/C/D-like domain-containing protein n=1 Tax=Luteipulveratus mongoliensis TaxID=571913 RepID=A0A0K1JNQ0_9MICO|nr:hypothetical protein [Luteipulveratus mongoliensis]AKU18208.1 hypothetical protein VV02_24085 [Luteipulveratus mongoliensis]